MDSDRVDRLGQSFYPLGNQKNIAVAIILGSEGPITGSSVLPTNEDVEIVKATFEQINVKVALSENYKELTEGNINEILFKLNETNFIEWPCFIFYYTGHGNANGIQLTNGSTYPFIGIVDRISSLPTLKGKPKVFIFDCCRQYDVDKKGVGRQYKAEAYTDCLIVHACSTGEQAYSFDKSIFTKTFCSALLKYRCQWPLISILIHAHRITQIDIQKFYSQTPEFEVKLTKQLYLCNDYNVEAVNRTISDQIHPSLLQIYKIVPAISSRWYDLGVMLFDYEHKIVLDLIRADHPNDMDACCKIMFRRWLEVNPCASWNQLLKALDDLGLVTITNEIYKLLRTDMSFSGQNPISRNEYHDAPPNRKVFKSKADVTGNLGSLGQRQKVFIFYGPSARPAGELESRVYNFARQLIIYGFEVVVDLFFNFTVGFEWASWTDREMSQADWIIFVCSESSYELLSYSNGTKEIEVSLPSVKKATPLDTAVNEITKKVRFSSKILYNRLFNDEKLRIIPVVLRKGDQHFILPILQDPQNVLHIYEDRPFDYDKFEGHFERLICRMANINRIALDNASAGQKTGYIKLKSKIPATRDPIQLHNQPIEQEETLQAPVNSTYRQISSVASIPGTSGAQSYQASPQHYHHNTHIHVTAHPSFNAPAQSYNHPVIPPMYQPQPHFRQPQYSQYYEHSHINDQYRNHNGDMHPSVIHNNVSHQLAVHQNIPAAPKAPADDLPSHKIPADSPILWQLSQDVREWKFLARFLDLDEEVIEEIDQYTRPNKTRDKSLKMLTEWVNTSSDATWKALGEAIQDAENTLLYEKLVELIKSYAI